MEALSALSVKALDGGGGGATGIRVGYVNQDSTAFPTTRPDGSPLQKEDYVSVDASAELPFTIGTITFNTKRDTAVWTGGQWVLSAGAVIESNEVFLKQKTRESLSGTQTIQSATNIEFANAIGRNVNISVDDKTNLIEALNYVWVECKKAGYTFTISNTDSDSIRSIVFNVKDKDDNVLINKTLDNFILKTRKVAGYDLVDDITPQEIQDAIKNLTATLTNKTIDADDNTVLNIETDNFKSGVIQTSVPATPTDTQLLSAKAVNDAKQDKLSNDTDYTDNPADSDTLANTNLTTKKVKKITFANLWKWIGRKLTTTKPSSSSTNTQVPSAKAVWNGLEDRVLNSYSQVSVTQVSTGEILFYKMGKIVIFSGWFYHSGSNDQLLCSSIPGCSSNNKFMATTGNGALRVYISGTNLRVENNGNAQYYSINGTYFTS